MPCQQNSTPRWPLRGHCWACEHAPWALTTVTNDRLCAAQQCGRTTGPWEKPFCHSVMRVPKNRRDMGLPYHIIHVLKSDGQGRPCLMMGHNILCAPCLCDGVLTEVSRFWREITPPRPPSPLPTRHTPIRVVPPSHFSLKFRAFQWVQSSTFWGVLHRVRLPKVLVLAHKARAPSCLTWLMCAASAAVGMWDMLDKPLVQSPSSIGIL